MVTYSSLKIRFGDSLVVQWLGLCVLTAEGPGSIPGWVTNPTGHAARPKNKKKKIKISFKKNVSLSWETEVLIIWEKAFCSAYCFDRETYCCFTILTCLKFYFPI